MTNLETYMDITNAIKLNQINNIKNLIENKVDVDIKDENGYPLLFFAISHKNIEIIDILIPNIKDINMTNKDGLTSLHFAIENRDYNIVKKLLLHSDIDINKKNNSQISPLLLAIILEYVEIVELLLSQSNIIIDDDIMMTTTQLKNDNILNKMIQIYQFDNSILLKNNLLHFMIKNQVDIRYIEKILDKNPNLQQCDSDGRTPLFLAAINKDNYLMNLLFGDIDEEDIYNMTPLCYMIFADDLEGVKILKNYCDINHDIGNSGIHLLHYVAYKGKSEIMNELLQEKDIDVNIKSKKYKYTPLHYAIKGKHIECIKLLLNHPNIDLIDIYKDGMTLLNCSISEKDDDISKMIVNHNKYKNVKDNYNSLEYASKFNLINTIIELINKDYELISNNYNTFQIETLIEKVLGTENDKIINKIAEKYKELILPLIIKKNINITNKLLIILENIINYNKKLDHTNNFLIKAVMKGNLNLIKLLLKLGVDVNQTDSIGDTSLMNIYYMRDKTYKQEIVETLLSHPDVNIYHINNRGESFYDIINKKQDFELLKLYKEKIEKNTL